MKIKRIFFVIIVLMLAFTAAVSARPIIIKLGTPTPAGSPWDDALHKLAAEWKDISGGQVILKIFPNGVAGDERDMIRKMRINTIQAAVISGAGLNDIASESIILNLPFLMHSENELDYVFQKMRPELESELENDGFKMIGWTMAGWMHFFSRDPVIYPEDLKKQKLAASDTDVAMAPALHALGFNTVSLNLNEIMAGLASGMVDACYTVPLGAVAYQWFGIAKNMCTMPMAPVLGGIIVSERTWRRIDDSIKPRLLAAAARTASFLEKQNSDTEKEIMQIMLDHGLVRNDVPPAVIQQWRDLFQKGFETLIGSSFSKQAYEQVIGYLESYRKEHGLTAKSSADLAKQ